MENSPHTIDGKHPEESTEEFQPDFTPPWQTEPESADKKRDIKERFFLTRKELRDAQRLLALREEELRKLRLAERRRVEQSHEEENLKSAQGRLQKRVDELQRQLTDSRNQLRQARTEAAERSAMLPLLERETGELREQLEQSEERLKELTGLLEQRELELREKNGSLHEANELSDRLDQRERDLLEREEQLHEAREQLGEQRGELESARRNLETLTAERDESLQQLGALRVELDTIRRTAEDAVRERDELAGRLTQTESSMRGSDETIAMLKEKLMESGEELVRLEESVRDYRYLMETLKREKADVEAASSRAVGELEKKVEASNNECEGLRELLKLRQQDQERIGAEKDELAAQLDRAAAAHREELASLEETHAGKIEDLRGESTRELTGVLQAHAQEIDKLKMMHAGELGELKASADRLRKDLELARERSGRLQLELDTSLKTAERLQTELEKARQGIPRLVARIEEREQAITDSRNMLADALARLEGMDQPPDLLTDQDQAPAREMTDEDRWAAHQTFGEFLDSIDDDGAPEDETHAPGDLPSATSLP